MTSSNYAATADFLAALRRQIKRMRAHRGHQLWCALFGQTVSWDDDLIHKIEPFVFALLDMLTADLEQQVNSAATIAASDEYAQVQLLRRDLMALVEVCARADIHHTAIECARVDLDATKGPGMPTNALYEIAFERNRQMVVEGYSPMHDAHHTEGDLAAAAACYANPIYGSCGDKRIPLGWPWGSAWWKPKDRRRDLVRAAALLVAEIDRLDRADRLGD